MNPALLFLVVRTFVHGTRARIARMKNPRYLVPFPLGAAYFGLLLAGPWRDARPMSEVERPVDARRMALVAEWIGAAIAILFVASAWLLPSRRPPLAFRLAPVRQSRSPWPLAATLIPAGKRRQVPRRHGGMSDR